MSVCPSDFDARGLELTVKDAGAVMEAAGESEIAAVAVVNRDVRGDADHVGSGAVFDAFADDDAI